MRSKTVDAKMTEMLRVRRLAEHHTTGDWDFSNAFWTLDFAVFVSAPSSLKCLPTDVDPYFKALVKIGVVPIANVKEGRFVTYFRYHQAGSENKLYIYFRYQDAANHYAVLIQGHGAITIYKVGGTGPGTIQTGTFTKAVDTWQQFRVTWWNDYVGLVIRVEMYEAGAWVIKAEGYDANNDWKDVGGRVGLGLKGNGAALPSWADDTEIYGVV